jgi:hypothetical protein
MRNYAGYTQNSENKFNLRMKFQDAKIVSAKIRSKLTFINVLNVEKMAKIFFFTIIIQKAAVRFGSGIVDFSHGTEYRFMHV